LMMLGMLLILAVLMLLGMLLILRGVLGEVLVVLPSVPNVSRIVSVRDMHEGAALSVSARSRVELLAVVVHHLG
jgi:hypothetical protein